ncbi:LCP family protein [Modestobacter roseus]|uniref:LCP family protein n=1 Tax=Modestobacter roseus TaxID=1181884 RepID=UPI001296A9B3|nr:LCP family protein [Modestobacter roseus]MQA36182.1 transcriptional regulator [Modestobacter roseus]
MTAPHVEDAGQGFPGRRPARPAPLAGHPRLRAALLVLAVLVVGLVADIGVLASRLDHVDVDLTGGPGDADGRTWVLVGLDSRAELPAGADVAQFGTAEDVPGARADVIVVVHQTDAGTTALSVPRDVVVRHDRRSGRLALAWRHAPDQLVDGLCQLGIPTDHLVTVDLAGFAAVVDAAGGLDVDVPEPVRDQPAGLEIDSAGVHHVDGATALALVRSRHPEHLVDGSWRPAPVDPDGRASAAGTVLAALLDQVQSTVLRPWRLQSVAWAGTGAVAVDPHTSATELAGLAQADLGRLDVLPVGEPSGGGLARRATAATAKAVTAAGLSCDR